MALPLARLLRPVADSLVFLGTTKVHETLYPFALAPTLHAARISIAYQSNARKSTRPLSWPTYLAGYLVMCWGGGVFSHLLLGLPPPVFYSFSPYINYITVHIALTALFSKKPSLLNPRILDTLLFPLDALVRTGAITAALSLLTTPNINPLYVSSPLTHLLLGAIASAGGGLSAATLSTWTPDWSFSTPPIFRSGSGIWQTVDVWGGAVVALVYGMATSNPAFASVSNTAASLGVSFAPDTLALSPLGARALGAAVLMVIFGLRVWTTHWMGDHKASPRHPSGTKSKTQ
ncbi:hypothetical protein AX17_004802 [Amanita inopinata Kibby_2008]|nr:hypothetical protein AX17_004802 [Amanita inopinata Kibby_2008]